MLYLLTAFSILGTVLNIRMKRSGFILWAGTNLIWMIIDFQAGPLQDLAVVQPDRGRIIDDQNSFHAAPAILLFAAAATHAMQG